MSILLHRYIRAEYFLFQDDFAAFMYATVPGVSMQFDADTSVLHQLAVLAVMLATAELSDGFVNKNIRSTVQYHTVLYALWKEHT